MLGDRLIVIQVIICMRVAALSTTITRHAIWHACTSAPASAHYQLFFKMHFWFHGVEKVHHMGSNTAHNSHAAMNPAS